MPSAYQFARAPRWVAGHLLVLALAVTMVLLGRWQLDVSNSKHFSLQNFGYALQWWAFATFTLIMWARLMRDRARARPAHLSHNTEPVPVISPVEVPVPQPPQPVAYRRYVMPQSKDAPAQAEDAVHAAYNDYLAKLARSAGEERT